MSLCWAWRGQLHMFAWTIGAALVIGVSIGSTDLTWAQQAAQQPAQPQPAPLAADADLSVRATKARDLAHVYSEKLRDGIAKALKEVGPVGAVGACNILAPELNATVTDDSTFEIGRTALRVRNPENAPDAWELAGLEQFQKALAGGSDAKTLEIYDVVTTKEGQRLFRYMRPITMREPCMTCHGTNVAQDVKAEIAKYYADDKALGFALGELRGAFSLVQQLD